MVITWFWPWCSVQAIDRLDHGETAVIDYSKNDVFAVGLIAYAMCFADPDALPWEEGPSRTRPANSLQFLQ